MYPLPSFVFSLLHFIFSSRLLAPRRRRRAAGVVPNRKRSRPCTAQDLLQITAVHMLHFQKMMSFVCFRWRWFLWRFVTEHLVTFVFSFSRGKLFSSSDTVQRCVRFFHVELSFVFPPDDFARMLPRDDHHSGSRETEEKNFEFYEHVHISICLYWCSIDVNVKIYVYIYTYVSKEVWTNFRVTES